MTHIIAYARDQGLATLLGIVLSENRAMLKLAPRDWAPPPISTLKTRRSSKSN